VVFVPLWLMAAGCRGPDTGVPVEDEPGRLVGRAQEFRRLLRQERWDEARAMMSENPRRWFAPREGAGQPWRIGSGTGPWSAWDEHFRTETGVVRWREGARSATVVVRETNDYFRLLERGSVINEITYFFDSESRIDGLLIDGVGERPPGRTEEFLRWAREHEPGELESLMPNGEIDPSGDHPGRYRTLLERWRSSAGLPPIERHPDR